MTIKKAPVYPAPFFRAIYPKEAANNIFHTEKYVVYPRWNNAMQNVSFAFIDLAQGFSMATYQKVTHGYFLLHPNVLAFCQAQEQGIIRGG